MRQIDRRIGPLFAILVGFSAVMCGSASGQYVPPPPDPNERQVMLMLQDFSNCSNSSVSYNDRDPSLQRGVITVVRSADGMTRVKVGMTARPNTTYHFFLKCIRHLGDIRTYDEGDGNGTFEFRTSEAGDTYAFDMYPEGAPAGNKLQSVQVKY